MIGLRRKKVHRTAPCYCVRSTAFQPFFLLPVTPSDLDLIHACMFRKIQKNLQIQPLVSRKAMKTNKITIH